MKPIAWYDPTNDVVSTDKDSPLFTPLGQVRPLYPQSEQKPVAIYRAGQVKGEVYHVQFLKGMEADEVLLYAAPPQRTWVGLTDKDWNRSKHNYDFQKGVDWAESILKEKNT
jgi:hypothetical protein